MSDQAQQPAARPATEVVGKLTPLHLGVPQGALANENINKATMGRIFGRATGIIRRNITDKITGEVSEGRGLRGMFVAISADTRRPERRSSVLYLPEGLVGGMVDAFVQAERENRAITINIAAEMFVTREKNPAGYSWGLRSLLPDSGIEDDPVAEVMKLAGLDVMKLAGLGAGGAPKIEAPSGSDGDGMTTDPNAAAVAEKVREGKTKK